jgi:hypothetical protein
MVFAREDPRISGADLGFLPDRAMRHAALADLDAWQIAGVFS